MFRFQRAVGRCKAAVGHTCSAPEPRMMNPTGSPDTAKERWLRQFGWHREKFSSHGDRELIFLGTLQTKLTWVVPREGEARPRGQLL